MKRILSIMLALVMIIGLLPMSILSASAAETKVVFDFGANGSASHADGSSKTTYSEENGDYTLDIKNGTSMYTGARDAKGNSCIKLGTSSKTGGFSFTVPAKVTSVIIAVAKYKSNTTKFTVNGATHTLTKNSNDGAYDEITVDTTSTKTVTVTTVSGGQRAMVNSITFVIPESSCAHANTTTTTVEADCDTAGSVTVTCDDCNNIVDYETLEALGHNFVGNTCSRCDLVVELANYELVTNVVTLTAGDKIILVGANEGKYYAPLPYTDGNNLKAEEIPAPVENVITLTDLFNVAIITLGADDNGWTLFDGAKYLNAPGGTDDNHLKGVAELPTDDTATWSISIAETGEATVVNVGNAASTESRNTIKFNYGNDPKLFNCYKASSTTNVGSVSIYREVKEGAESCQHTNTIDIAEIPATCGKAGSSAGVKCTDCGEIISGCEEISATDNHNFVDYVCGVCGAVSLPEADATLSLPTANALGLSYEHNTYTEGKYYVTGVIDSVTNATYGNLYIKDESGNKLLIYGLFSEDGNTRYDAMETKPVAGDTITVYGILGQFSGAAQMKNGWVTEHIPAAVCEHTNTTTTREEPTCVKAGVETETCVDCGATVSTELIPVLPHSYINGVCENCGWDKNTVEATITFDDVNKRIEFTTTSQVWEENGVTVTNNKASSTSNVADYSKPARFYKGSQLTVAYTGMIKIVFNCNNAEYATALGASITAGKVTVSEKVVTVEFETAVDSFTVESLSAKVFVDSLTVYGKKAAPTIEITHISLDAANDALGFKAVATNMPEGAQLQLELWIDGGNNIIRVVSKETMSLRLKNIMKNDGGETVIYAKATIVQGDQIVAESKVEDISMQEAIQMANGMEGLSDTQKTAIYNLYKDYESVMSGWFEEGKNNIVAWDPTKA